VVCGQRRSINPTSQSLFFCFKDRTSPGDQGSRLDDGVGVLGSWADHPSLLRNEMDPDQAKRFDAFQTAVIPKQAIKRVSRVGPGDSFQSSFVVLRR
jgi:hypothetical protein